MTVCFIIRNPLEIIEPFILLLFNRTQNNEASQERSLANMFSICKPATQLGIYLQFKWGLH